MTRTSCSSRIITLLLMIISFLHGGFTLNSDGLTLLSLLTHWTFVPPLINSSWKASDSDPCSWFGVQCDRKQNLISLNLTSHEIFGQLGPEIGNLYHLENLLLFGNSFSGKVPSELSNCSLLEKLDLSENRFNGKIPHSLKRLRNLKSMRLSSNLLTGEIPDSLFEIPSLEEVSLHSNLLSGNIPTNIGNLTHLLRLYLYGNMFSGTIPSSLGNCSKLEDLELSSNRLRGKIPVSIWRISSLVHILVHNNNLSGELPFEMTNLRYLKNISLFFNENNFTGSLPDFESNMNLKYMDMSKNSIGGPIPSSLGNYTNLTYINLSSNKFAGLIPLELGNLANLVILDLSHNNLEGPLPLQLSKCTNMDRFDVGFNFLNGSFPSSLISWRGISTLVLRENHFTGGIPGFLAEFSNLRELQLGGNSFGGKIPRSMGTLHNLFYGLNLSDNGLTGGIPSEIGMLGLLQSLDISLNNLTGNIDALEGLVSLIEVNISYNLFNGSVPTRLIRLLNSSPSSFMGNPLLCFRCLNCFKTSFINPCIYKPTDHKGIGNVQIVMIELGPSIFVSGVVVIIILTYLRRNELKKGSDPKQQSHTERKLPDLHDRVLEATENLNDQYIIGRGAHGIVYKAIVYRRVCAIKKVQYGWNKQKWLSIMRSEIEVLRMIRHRNLIKYRNHWIGNDYGLVIYDFIDNGSLYNILHEKKPPPPLTWNVRFNLAVGIAQGLAYLHYDCVPPIVHRDIKPKNILVDDNLEPIIADFGTALHRKLFEDSYSHSETRKMLSSRVVGTPGYIAPGNLLFIHITVEFHHPLIANDSLISRMWQ